MALLPKGCLKATVTQQGLVDPSDLDNLRSTNKRNLVTLLKSDLVVKGEARYRP